MALTVEKLLNMPREQILDRKGRKIVNSELDALLFSLRSDKPTLIAVLAHMWGEKPTEEELEHVIHPEYDSFRSLHMPVNPSMSFSSER